MHKWGDENVDWKGLNEAPRYIGTFLRKWGRVGVRDCKEKYGTVRVYLGLGWYSLHDVTHPGHCFSRYPKWLWTFCHSKPMLNIFQILNRVVVPYHIFLYKFIYKRAVKKWPHLVEEICCMADYQDLIKDIPDWKVIRLSRKVAESECERLESYIAELEERVSKLEKPEEKK